MLYNKKLKKIQATSHCLTCEFFDKKKKKCLGFGKNCFEYDPTTKTVIDPITRLPIILD